MVSEAQKRAQQKYDSENCIRFGVKLNKKTDSDIIKWLDKETSKQGAIKRAVRYYLNSTAY